MTIPTAATPELARLNPFVGTWATEGEVLGGGPEPAATFRARDSYEWMPGGHFLLHRFEAEMPDGQVQGLEVIGAGREPATFAMRSFDSTGQASVMTARVTADAWTFEGENVRFRGGFRDEGRQFLGRWELRSDDEAGWQPWMDVRLRRKEPQTFDDRPRVQACDECGGDYLTASSQMWQLCPECAHYLYGYPLCDHVFVESHCSKCGWSGTRSDYILQLIETERELDPPA
jgi:hypothetical protein